MKNIAIDIDKDNLENIDIAKAILGNIYIVIDIDKDNHENIDTDKDYHENIDIGINSKRTLLKILISIWIKTLRVCSYFFDVISTSIVDIL